MPDQLLPPDADAAEPPDPSPSSLRALSRSPHPYHHQSHDLPYRSETRGQPSSSFTKESTPGSDSGTEADDEHFLKGLPAPKVRPHKGVRGRDEPLSGTSTPLPSPVIREGDETPSLDGRIAPKTERKDARRGPRLIDVARRRKAWVQRAAEACIVATLAGMVRWNPQVSPIVDAWAVEIRRSTVACGVLLVIYPLRVVAWGYRHRPPLRTIPLSVPSHFDPAPLLYPPVITILVSLLISTENPAVVLPNLVLSFCSLPNEIFPSPDSGLQLNTLHWVLSCLPLLSLSQESTAVVTKETLTLLYPLHRSLCSVLHHLTTTSLLTAELQLLSIALINLLILASSPQMQILKALLWVGGMSVLVLCGTVIRWGITLARVPKWRFRKFPTMQSPALWTSALKVFSWRRIKNEVLGPLSGGVPYDTEFSDFEEEPLSSPPKRTQTFGQKLDDPDEPSSPEVLISRRHTMPFPGKAPRKTHTPAGRPKRAMSISVRPYLKFTQPEATLRKWVYAAYVYISMLVIIAFGVRTYIQKYALFDNEPIGWGLGYAFGEIPWFRLQVVTANLERWICLPPRSVNPLDHEGWVQHLRHTSFGEATTRLLLTGYWLGILSLGLIIVLQLSDTYEVDTRRKVFHFTMVGMFLPATFIDPTYAALCLSLALAIFLIMDLLRASQLPPLSKPIASFLAPYVDGRDFRGPVVISHIFLLIGCAIPLWLALAALPRTGTGYMAGWELPSRDVSMVAGVICVGLGDAAASLIGRRYGNRKWIWGGGKSLEGSLAFAVAVFVGLGATSAWLRIGGWPVAGQQPRILASAANAASCATMASLTEAVLTGGNDNVIVPVVLWTCVKSLGV